MKRKIYNVFDLPNVLWNHIFQFSCCDFELWSQLLQVCKLWSELVQKQSIADNLIFCISKRKTLANVNIVKKLAIKLPAAGAWNMEEDMINKICRFKKLTYLHISGFCRYYLVLDWSTCLTHVHIQNCLIQYQELVYICSLQTITSFTFSFRQLLNDELYLLSKLTNLTYLKFEKVSYTVKSLFNKPTFKLLNTLEIKNYTGELPSLLRYIHAPLLRHLICDHIDHPTEFFPMLETFNFKPIKL